MRTLLATALVLTAASLAACGSGDRAEPAADSSPAARTRGPESFVLRVPRTGGRARVYAYERLDSLVWEAPGAPPVADVLGFDPEQGVIAYVDAQRVPGRIDLRMGDVARAGSRFTLTGARSADGSAIFGVDAAKAVRYTATGRWEFDPEAPVGAVFPQGDGSLVALSRPDDGEASLWRVFPPENDVLDSARIAGVRTGPRLQAGDRLYVATETGFAVHQARTLESAPPIALEGEAVDAAATPSGDRVFIAVDGSSEIAVYERYRNAMGAPLAMPGPVRGLRVDPFGRYLLARPAEGDSVWVIALGTLARIGAMPGAWRADLPLVAPDGRIAMARGADVVLVDGASLAERARVRGGAADFWYVFQWTGFRPRAAGLDRPVEFTPPAVDSLADSSAAPADSGAPGATTGLPPAANPPASSAPSPSSAPAPAQWVVNFASVLSEGGARALADQISVDGVQARVQTTVRDGTPVYRVLLGPYPDRAAADRAGRAAGRPYWVYASGP